LGSWRRVKNVRGGNDVASSLAARGENIATGVSNGINIKRKSVSAKARAGGNPAARQAYKTATPYRRNKLPA